MKGIFLKLITIIAMISMACTVSFNLPASQVGELQTVDISETEPVPGGAARVEIAMGGGTLNLSGGASNLIDGTVEYNLPEWEPKIERSDSTVRIEQEIDTIPIPQTGREITNRWNLMFGDTPIDLQIEAGAFQGTLNFSGVPITRLTISGGASDAEIRFDTPNPERMTRFEYRTGASDVELHGLSNANFEEMFFTGAAGDYTIDFSGEAQQESSVDITGAVGKMTIMVPAGRSAQVNLSGGLRDVNTRGDWEVGDNVYTLAGSGPQLTIDIEMNIGNLELVAQ